MEFTVSPESNPAPEASLSRPDHVNVFDEDGVSRSPSTAHIAGEETLTELTGDDIFRMKELRNSDSMSESEAAEMSQSAADTNTDNFESKDLEGEPAEKNPRFDPTAARDRSSELNEEDIFRMKSLSLSRHHALSEQANQSAVSLVDSASNMADLPDNEEEYDGKSEEPPDSPPTMLTFSGQYVFNRRRPEKPELNSDTCIELTPPFEPLGQPPNGVSREEYLQLYNKTRLYVIGTAHFSPESQNDVVKAITEVQPDVVMVELCAQRVSILSLDEETLLREAKTLNRQKIMNLIRDNGIVQGLLQVLLLSTSAHITEQLGMAPGGEFRAAHKASFRIPGCKLILGDRPIQVTLQRALSSLGFFQRIRLLYHVISSNRSSVTQEDVERCKDKDLLESLLKEMAGEFPQLSKIFVEERDKYMAYVLQTIMQSSTAGKITAWKNCKNRTDYQPLNMVAVVGIGHIKGIQEAWNTHVNNLELLEIPPPSFSSRAVGFVFKVAVISSLGYLSYKAGRGIYYKVVPAVTHLIR
ncbi:unnamed protein product [Bursaphelenchus xylophilus]|uniref:(pine wood nematode) hypothetical protein n=1 Tax=Bursaphelenchus xylophilus TaxID=6326 RepID=A0A1I7RIX4_BURXY|nr:unnamed protein product [Bursaphelenchus xylophilus]CAG9119156.1 unnamed protein product [Bursaphelenchus xylophilus]